jgi:hypothetical protein
MRRMFKNEIKNMREGATKSLILIIFYFRPPRVNMEIRGGETVESCKKMRLP